MVEFATILSVISVLSVSLGGLQARVLQRLATSDAVATQQAVLRAKAVGVPGAGARAAYRRAPYTRPALRYVYANGWTAGVKNQQVCLLAKAFSDDMRAESAKAIRASGTTVRKLRSIHVTVTQAAAAFSQGFLSSCGG